MTRTKNTRTKVRRPQRPLRKESDVAEGLDGRRTGVEGGRRGDEERAAYVDGAHASVHGGDEGQVHGGDEALVQVRGGDEVQVRGGDEVQVRGGDEVQVQVRDGDEGLVRGGDEGLVEGSAGRHAGRGEGLDDKEGGGLLDAAGSDDASRQRFLIPLPGMPWQRSEASPFGVVSDWGIESAGSEGLKRLEGAKQKLVTILNEWPELPTQLQNLSNGIEGLDRKVVLRGTNQYQQRAINFVLDYHEAKLSKKRALKLINEWKKSAPADISLIADDLSYLYGMWEENLHAFRIQRLKEEIRYEVGYLQTIGDGSADKALRKVVKGMRDVADEGAMEQYLQKVAKPELTRCYSLRGSGQLQLAARSTGKICASCLSRIFSSTKCHEA
eukprot:763100-Hanusia_phi.AAC.25